jgi:hypothetical protein
MCRVYLELQGVRVYGVVSVKVTLFHDSNQISDMHHLPYCRIFLHITRVSHRELPCDLIKFTIYFNVLVTRSVNYITYFAEYNSKLQICSRGCCNCAFILCINFISLYFAKYTFVDLLKLQIVLSSLVNVDFSDVSLIFHTLRSNSFVQIDSLACLQTKEKEREIA